MLDRAGAGRAGWGSGIGGWVDGKRGWGSENLKEKGVYLNKTQPFEGRNRVMCRKKSDVWSE